MITTGVANNSGLRFENLTSQSPIGVANNGKVLTLDANGVVVLTNDAIGSSYWSLAGSTVATPNAIQIGNTANLVAGSIRWTGSDFEGYDGSQWKTFTQNKTLNDFWVNVPGGNSCLNVCPSNYVNIPDGNDKVCMAANGVFSNGTVWYSLGGYYMCGLPVGLETNFQRQNVRCRCVKYQ